MLKFSTKLGLFFKVTASPFLKQSSSLSFGFASARPRTNNIIGIDLGTTMSYAAQLEGTQPKAIPLGKSKSGFPSLVALDKNGKWLVGDEINENEANIPKENIFYATKRLIGKRFEEPSVQNDLNHLLYKIVKEKHGGAAVQAGGQDYSLEFLNAIILKRIKEIAEASTKKTIEEAVLTVPSYFSDQQRRAVLNAGKIAGFNVLKLMNESTAAAMAYMHTSNYESKTFAVFNLGGGHFDVSIFEWNYGVLDVKAMTSRASLGGEDINVLVQYWITDDMKSATGVDISKNKTVLWKLRESIERARHELNTKDVVEIKVTAENKEYKYPMTKAKLEELIEKLMARAAETCERALKDSGLEKNAIEEVILIGDMTDSNKVYEIIKKIFGKTPRQVPSQENIVSFGAAIEGGILSGIVKEKLALDVTPHTLSAEITNFQNHLLIPRNSVIPAQKDILVADPKGLKKVQFKLYQGENQELSKNRIVGEYEINNIPETVKDVELSCLIDSSGFVNVTAKDKATETELPVNQNKGGLTEEEVYRLQDQLKSL